jgi:hypothetical protein
MIRQAFIEQILRQIYGGQPSDDSDVTIGLINQYLNQAIGVAAKQNYKENFQLDGIGYVNNSFNTTFKGLSIIKDENFLYKCVLPEVPLGIGRNEGVLNVVLKNNLNQLSYDGIPLSNAQKGYSKGRRGIPNKILYYSEGNAIFIMTSILLDKYTAMITMISGGDSTDLNSVINVPSDYVPIMVEYIKQQLAFEKAQIKDINNDGVEN